MRARSTNKSQGHGQIIMKKFFVCLVLTTLGFSLNLYAEKIPVKKNGQQKGYVEYSYSNGHYIEREGWGQQVIVSLYNDSNETVTVYVQLKGVRDPDLKNVKLKPYATDEIIIYTEDTNYRGIAINVL